MAQPLLQTEDVFAGYGAKPVLRGVSLQVGAGESVAIIGANASGKSTLLKAIFGLVQVTLGTVRFNGVEVTGQTPARNRALGFVYVPQGRRVFAELSVRENVLLGGPQLARGEAEARTAEALAPFPGVARRLNARAGRLSGGEQQMVALARALVSRPRLLLLDEPCLGLAPRAAAMILERLRELQVRERLALLIVEQRVAEILPVCERVYGLRRGAIALAAPADGLIHDVEAMRDLYL